MSLKVFSYADDIALLANRPNKAETLLHSLERATAGIGHHVNAHKTEYMCYNQTGDISTLDGTTLKLVDKFTNLGRNVSSTEKDIDTRLTKTWTAIDRLSIIWKSDLTDKMKRSFFQAAVVSILLYGCTTWTLTKRLEKKLDGSYSRMLRAILNNSWQWTPIRRQLYGHLPPITKTIQARRTRHAGHCWRSKDELISDVLQWTPAYGQAKAERPARTYIQQLCEDTGCSPEDLPEAMNDKEKWRERVRDVRASGTTWWWWWSFLMWDFACLSLEMSIQLFFSFICFLIIVILLILMLSVLFLVAVASLSQFFFYVFFESSYRCISAIFSLANPCPPFFLVTHILSTSSLVYYYYYHYYYYYYYYYYYLLENVRGEIIITVIIVWYGIGDPNSNPQ